MRCGPAVASSTTVSRCSPRVKQTGDEQLFRLGTCSSSCFSGADARTSSWNHQKMSADGEPGRVNLAGFDNSWYSPGRSFFVQTLWYLVNALFFQNPLNVSSASKVVLLRWFGAKVGRGVVIKPSVNIKYPWRLELGDNVWVGERAWLDSLTTISIGDNVCISQGAYLCTGNHDWSDVHFGLIVKPIVAEAGVWIGARSVILPGVTLRSHSIVAAGSVVGEDTEPYTVNSSWELRVTRRRNVGAPRL